MSSSLPAEKLTQLRQAIHDHVSQGNIQEQIRACLADVVTREGGRPVDEAALLQALEDRGLVDQVIRGVDGMCAGAPPTMTQPLTSLSPHLDTSVMGRNQPHPPVHAPPSLTTNLLPSARHPVTQANSLHFTRSPTKRAPPPPAASPPLHVPLPPLPSSDVSPTSRRCLFLTVVGGRAFLDHLMDSSSPHCHDYFTLHLLFRGQRFSSRDVPCACEPDFSREGFLFELGKHRLGTAPGRLISATDALSLSDVVQLSLVRTSHRGEVELVGTSLLEWRPVLCEESSRISLSLELSGVGPEAKISPGVLDVQLDLVPRLSAPVARELLTAQLELERQRSGEKERLFLVYAKQWWKEFLSLREDHTHRLVKIFAPDEMGVMHPVCSYVSPLRGGRLLDSPRHAARMVSLVPVGSVGGVGCGGSSEEVWTRTFSTLAARRGRCEDHACLLCSLLLGFGLEAWVCVGAKVKEQAHAWVMTLSHDGGVVFWESITGQRFIHLTYDPNIQAGGPAPTPSHPYRTVGCVFNHETFYANCQPTDSVSTCRFDLRDPALWKPMSPDAIRSVCRYKKRCGPVLLPPTCDPSLAANEMEEQLRTLTSQHRSDLGLSTVWDEDLCYLLTPALASYEAERCLGVGGVGNEEFQDAIHKAVPEGHTFKGFPLQVPHRNPRKVFLICLKSPVCSEILGCKGDQVRLAVRVKVYMYPENICAVWVMFAVKYHSVL